jgi:hypothetical protein
MRITPDAADRMAADAQLFAGTRVAARACGWIAAGFATVAVLRRREPDPSGSVWAAAAVARDAALGMT